MTFVDPFQRTRDARVGRQRLKEWTRARFRLAPDTAVYVSEVAGTLPGFPPVETIVSFSTDDPDGGPERRHHVRLFKPVADIVEDDLPPWWMRDRLIVDAMAGCDCC